jgi:hypothetical protein
VNVKLVHYIKGSEQEKERNITVDGVEDETSLARFYWLLSGNFVDDEKSYFSLYDSYLVTANDIIFELYNIKDKSIKIVDLNISRRCSSVKLLSASYISSEYFRTLYIYFGDDEDNKKMLTIWVPPRSGTTVGELKNKIKNHECLEHHCDIMFNVSSRSDYNAEIMGDNQQISNGTVMTINKTSVAYCSICSAHDSEKYKNIRKVYIQRSGGEDGQSRHLNLNVEKSYTMKDFRKDFGIQEAMYASGKPVLDTYDFKSSLVPLFLYTKKKRESGGGNFVYLLVGTGIGFFLGWLCKVGLTKRKKRKKYPKAGMKEFPLRSTSRCKAG